MVVEVFFFYSLSRSCTLLCRPHTCITAPCAHAGWQQRPLVRHRIVKLHGGQVAAAVVSPHHIEQVINSAHAWAETWTKKKKNSKVRGHFARQHLTNTTKCELRPGPACVTGVASTHVHVGHLSPAVAARIINLATFPHQGAVVATYGVQQTFQHAHACSGK